MIDVHENEPGFKFYTYKYLNRENTKLLHQTTDKDSAINAIQSMLQEQLPSLQKVDLMLLVDIFIHIWEYKLEPLKMSTLYGIFMHSCISLLAGYTSREVMVEQFKNDMVMHSVQRPPHSLKILNKHEYNLATDLFLSKIYQPYPLLTNILTHKETMDLKTAVSTKFNGILPTLTDAKEIDSASVPELAQFFPDKIVTEEDILRDAEDKRRKNIEQIIHDEISQLQVMMESKMEEQEKQFMDKLG